MVVAVEGVGTGWVLRACGLKLNQKFIVSTSEDYILVEIINSTVVTVGPGPSLLMNWLMALSLFVKAWQPGSYIQS